MTTVGQAMAAENQPPAVRRQGRLVGSAVTYVVLDVSQRAASFLLLPLFARKLSPDEFGQLALIASVTAVGTIVLGLGLELPAFRGCFIGAGSSGGEVSTI